MESALLQAICYAQPRSFINGHALANAQTLLYHSWLCYSFLQAICHKPIRCPIQGIALANAQTLLSKMNSVFVDKQYAINTQEIS